VAFSNSSTNNSLNISYSLTTAFYSKLGQDRKTLDSLLPDYNAKMFWNFIYFGVAFGIVVSLIAFFLICCKNYDPPTDFERRRKQ
jgi:hypothetical protein